MLQAALPPEPPQQAIIVTGRALPRPASEKILHSEALSADVLRSAPSRSVERLLDRFTGVQLFRRSDSRTAHPTSQGVTIRALGGNAASRVQLLLDGVPQSDPFGGWIDWAAFNPDDLREIRLTRGGGSVVTGPGALGGTIELVTASDPMISASVDHGSRESLEVNFSARGRLGSGSAGTSLKASRGDGFTPVAGAFRGPADRPAPYANASGRLHWFAPLGDTVELQAGLLAFADERERGLKYSKNRTRGGDASLRLVSDGSWGWSVLAYGQLRNFRSSFASTDIDRTEARRVSLQYDVPGRSAGWSAELRPPLSDAVELRIGADGRLMDGESRELATYVAGAPQRDRLSGGEIGYAGLFSEASWHSGPVVVSAGARADHWSISDGRLVETVISSGVVTETHFDSRSGWRPTARLGAAFDLSPSLSLRAATYLGWRLPTLNELFRPFRVGADATAANAALKPERSRGAELGAGWASDELRATVTVFANRLQDAIANVTLGIGPGTFPGVGFVAGTYRQRQNLEAIRVHGIEASGSWTRGPWQARVSSSYSDARVSAQGASAPLDGLRPAQTPKFAAAASVQWEDRRRFATLVLHYEGKRFEDDLNSQILSSALTLDAAAAVPLSKDWAVVARAENLFNADIAAGISGDGVIERATPRTLWIGLRFAR